MKQSLSETHPHFHRVYFVVVFLLICLNLRMSFSAADGGVTGSIRRVRAPRPLHSAVVLRPSQD